MYKVGFIDDDSVVNDYSKRLKRKEIELVFVDSCKTKKDVLDWILFIIIQAISVDIFSLNFCL